MIFTLFLLLSHATSTQWLEPTSDLDYNCNQNQAFQSENGKNYYRLPPRAQQIVRARIWQLSRHSASITIKFLTNSSKLQIKYQRESASSFRMMSAIGTSGIDLYGYDSNGEPHFFSGTFSVESTVTFNFDGFNASTFYLFMLILPSYDVVKPGTIQIGYDDDSYFKVFQTEKEIPITTYGTSIMHGACPNRPGLTWINWMSRDLGLPVHNFGFQGQGILETNVIDFIIEERARAFILDCLPNLVFDTVEKVVNLSIAAYNQIRKKWPDTPIVFVEFGGYTNYEFNNQYKTYTDNMNIASRQVKELLKDDKLVFYVYQSELGITSDDISDPVHPMDNGMRKQKEALVNVLKKALNIDTITNDNLYSTQKPFLQHRNLNFFDDHQNILKKLIDYKNDNSINKAIIGDSIVKNWQSVSADTWKNMQDNGFINLGVSLDRIENALYRVYHDELDYIQHQKIISLIGTFNLDINNETEIIYGIKYLLQKIQIRQKNAQIVVCGILPRDGFEQKVKNINIEIKKIAENENWIFADPGEKLLDANTGLINNNYFIDGIHLNKNGYEIIAPIIANL